MRPSPARHLFLLTLLAALVSIPAAAQKETSSRLQADLSYLADDQLQGRKIGSAGADSAAAYIARRFKELGLRPAPTLKGWIQDFTVAADAPAIKGTDLGGVTGHNVIAVLRGRDRALAGQYLVIGAHYDHLGLGGSGSLDPDSLGVVHNGADDNASGVVTMLEVARRMALHPPARSVLFIAFSGEEEGLLGSAAYVKHAVVPMDSVVAMLNFDMVGRLRDDKLVVYGVLTASEWRPLLDSLNASAGFKLAAQGDGYGPSDQTSFTVAKRPVLHFFTGTHVDYHRTTDDWAKINLEGMARIAAYASDIGMSVANRGAGLTFVDLPAPAPPSGAARSSGYGAYLGSIPDMTENPGGVRVSGVRGGSPAELAGLKAGDIITRIGDYDVPDLQGMTDALRSYKPGDEVEVTIKRDGQAQKLRVTLGRRGG